MQLSAVEDALKSLAQSFRLIRIKVESWQGLSSVQRLGKLGLPVELFTPTQKTNADEWPVLAQRLSARTLVLPPHARLREELLNLCVEAGPTGIKVTDRCAVHQDHAVAVRGVVAQLVSTVNVGTITARGLSPVPIRRSLRLDGGPVENADDPARWDYSRDPWAGWGDDSF